MSGSIVSSVRVGNKNVSHMDSSVLSQAYSHQLPIHIDVVQAKKYLGDVLDPIQSEAEEMVGAHVVMKPPEFPKAFPCNVSVDENIVVEYLLLRTKEILDDGTVIITNEEQKNFNFYVRLTLNPLTHRLSFSIKPSNPTNAESLRYRMFLKRASLANKVSLKVLSLGRTLMEGKPDPIDLCLLNSEIEFLEKIVAIEKYFEIGFHIPEKITLEDYKTIDYIYSMIKLGSYKGKWDKLDLTFIVSNDIRQIIANLTDEKYMLAYSEGIDIELFGKSLKFLIRCKINCAKLEDVAKAKAKIKVLDNDEEIKLKYIPGEDDGAGSFIDVIYSEEAEQQLFYQN